MLEGALEHKDSLGTGSVIRAGDIQRMSAGTGIEHSEFNPSKTSPVHFLQIWVLPEKRGIEPGYEQRSFSEETRDGLALVASRSGREGSVTIHQDADLYLARLRRGEELSLPLGTGRLAWLQMARGQVALGGQSLRAGDGAALKDEAAIALQAEGEAEILLFDMGT